MNKRDIIIYIFISLIVTFIVYITSTSQILEPEENNTHTPLAHVNINIITPSWNISYTSYNTMNTSVADLLIECATFYEFTIEKDHFSGYNSYFITSINGIENGENDSYWQYYVNDFYADKGCSTYYLSNNDTVTWVFEPSPWF